MKEKPFFTIITCTKNSGKFLMKNLDSVEKQKYKNYEQIIIDGESIDDTIKIVKLFSRQSSKIKLFSYPAKGISNAFNLGLKHSKGEYIIFINSDDYLYDKNVLKEVNAFLKKNNNFDWIYGKVNVIEEDGGRIGEFPRRKILQTSNRHLLNFVNFIPHQAVFMKKEVFDKFGNFDVTLKTNMDFDLWLRVASKTKWSFYNKLISNYTIHEGSASSSLKNRGQTLEEYLRVQKRHLNVIETVFARIVDIFIVGLNTTFR